jgi:pilus assembly protein Flp/PilA
VFLGWAGTMNIVKIFLGNESGATAIEYALIASMIALVIVASVTTIGNKLLVPFTEVSSNLK